MRRIFPTRSTRTVMLDHGPLDLDPPRRIQACPHTPFWSGVLPRRSTMKLRDAWNVRGLRGFLRPMEVHGEATQRPGFESLIAFGLLRRALGGLSQRRPRAATGSQARGVARG